MKINRKVIKNTTFDVFFNFRLSIYRCKVLKNDDNTED